MNNGGHQGCNFIRKKNYEQARICFENIGEEKMCKIMDIKINLRDANRIEEDIKIRKILNSKISTKDLQIKKNEALIRAASAYFQLNRIKQAGKVYFQAQSYQKAYERFVKQQMIYEMGRCKQEMKENIEAAKLYESCNSYEQMLRCFQNSKNYVLAMAKMKQHANGIKDFKKRTDETKKQIIKLINSQFGKYLDSVQISSPISQANSKGKILQNNYESMKHSLIANIRIAFVFQDSSCSQSLSEYLRIPFNIKKFIKRLQNLGEFKLCLMLADLYNRCENIEEYYAVCLYEKYPKPQNLNNNCSSSIPNEKTQQAISIIKQINLLNLQSLLYIQQNIKPRIISNIIINLVLCGFYRECEVFFQNKQQFYFTFLLNHELLKLTNNQIKNEQNMNNTVQQKIKLMKVIDWEKNLSEKQVVFCLSQLFSLHCDKQSKVQKLLINLKKQLDIIRQKIGKLSKQKTEAEQIHTKKLKQFAQGQTTRKRMLQKLKEQEQEYNQEKQKCYEEYKKSDNYLETGDEYLQKLLNNEKYQGEIEDFGEQFMCIRQQIIKNNVRLMINRNHQQRQEVDLQNYQQQMRRQLNSYQSVMSTNRKNNRKRQDLLKEIEYLNLIDKFYYGGGYYAPFYKSQLVHKDLNAQISAIQLFGDIQLKQFSPFLHAFFGNQQINQQRLIQLLNFNVYEQNHIKICQITILVLSILFKQSNIIQNIKQIRQNQHSQNSIITGIRKCFRNMIRLLEQNTCQNNKFVQIMLQFLQIRLFKDNQELDILSGYGIMSSQTEQKLKFINYFDISNYTYLDQNKTLLLANQRQIKQSTIKYIKKQYWNIFGQNISYKNKKIEKIKEQSQAGQKSKTSQMMNSHKKRTEDRSMDEQKQEQQPKWPVIKLQEQEQFKEEKEHRNNEQHEVVDEQSTSEWNEQQQLQKQQELQANRYEYFYNQLSSENEQNLNLNIQKIQQQIESENSKRLELLKIILFRKSGRKFKLHHIKRYIRNASDNNTIMFYLLRELKDTQQILRRLNIEKQLIYKQLAILQSKKKKDNMLLEILKKEREAKINKLKTEQSQNSNARTIQRGQDNLMVISCCQHCSQRNIETTIADFEKRGQVQNFCKECVKQFECKEDKGKQDVYTRFGFEIVK